MNEQNHPENNEEMTSHAEEEGMVGPILDESFGCCSEAFFRKRLSGESFHFLRRTRVASLKVLGFPRVKGIKPRRAVLSPPCDSVIGQLPSASLGRKEE